MPDVVRFEMKPQDDLSIRADFTADLMAALSRELSSVVDSAPELEDLRKKAKIIVSAHGMLRSVEIKISIVRAEGAELTDQEIERARKEISKRIAGAVRAKIGVVLQGAITQARARM